MNIPKRFIAAALGALLIPGCMTKAPPNSDEVRGEALAHVALPENWKAGGDAGAIGDNWLAAFADPQLDELVREALANNPDLRVSASRVEQAGQYVVQAKAALLPAVGLYGTGGLNAGGGDVSSALSGLMLPISWEPDLWGRIRYGRNAAEASQASLQADFEFARQSLAATMAKSWFVATETLLQKQMATEMVAAAQQLLELAETRERVGIGSQLDVALARANLRNFEDTLQQVTLAHGQAMRAVELLLGRYPAAELAARAELPAFPGPIPAGLPLEMLERRPDLIAAENRVAVAFHRVGEAKAAMLPRITLNASAGVFDSAILQLQSDFENPSIGAGAKLSAPIYTGGALRSQVELRTLEQKEAVAAYARLALRALGDVENALAAGQSLEQRDLLLTEAVADSDRALELTQTSYRLGRSDLRAVQQQQISVYATRLALLRVQSERLSQRANLHLALGGSFAAPTVEPAPAETAAPAETPAPVDAAAPADGPADVEVPADVPASKDPQAG